MTTSSSGSSSHADGAAIERFWTYFHGRILEGGDPALRDARAHDMRPRVNVQWGKHGSLPDGWESMPIQADEGDIERKYLSIGNADLSPRLQPRHLAEVADGGQASERASVVATAPMARHVRRRLGPIRRVHASRRPDSHWLDRHRMVSVSRWNSAVIDQQFLAYNFRAKTEWPDQTPAGPSRATEPATAGRSDVAR